MNIRIIITLLLASFFNLPNGATADSVLCEDLPWRLISHFSEFSEKQNGVSHCTNSEAYIGELSDRKIILVPFTVEGACGSGKLEDGEVAGGCGNHTETYIFAELDGVKKKFSNFLQVPEQINGNFTAGIEKIEVKDRAAIIRVTTYNENDTGSSPTGVDEMKIIIVKDDILISK